MTVGIYGIFDAETDECLYVGLSKNIEQRRKSHLKLLRSKTHPRVDFVEWFHANGAVEKLLDFRILEECKNNDTILNALEIKWFNRLKPKYFGKQPSLNEKWEHSKETRTLIAKKVREANLKILENRNCPCGETFGIFQTSKKMYCSSKCGKRIRFEKTGKRPPSYYKERDFDKIKSQHNCYLSSCDNVFVRYEKKKEGKKYFCSYDCSSEYFYEIKGLTKDTVEKFVKEKMPLRQMALQFNCSHQTIKNFMIKNNIRA